MIRIERPPNSPEILRKKGDPETRVNCEAYDRFPDDYGSGAKTFTFKKRTYGGTSVKQELQQAQHEKCCYCESKFQATSPGAVEHFRPKGAVRREHDRPKEYPGYYWLAYDWNNLLASCEQCNTAKGILFPVVNDGARARSHHDDVEEECPLFIDPSREDPRRHIRFRGAAVEPLTRKGGSTILGLKLRRWNLREARMKELSRLKLLRGGVKIRGKMKELLAPEEFEKAKKMLAKEVLKWKRQINDAVLPTAEYSSMVRDFLEANEVQGDGT